MSMNLHASTKIGEINLWQTPTRISYTIIPEKFDEVKGKEASEALERYIEWVKYIPNGLWDSAEEMQYAKHRVNEHIKYVLRFINDKTLCMWVA